MKTYTEKIGNKLNELLEKTYDAEKGFRKAADHTDHSYLKEYFEKKAEQRKDFGYQLKTEISTFGQNVETGDSVTSKMHRAWMDIKALFSSESEEAMLEEAIRGEKAAISEYEDVLSETALPPTTKMLLQKQKDSIKSGLTTVKSLEKAF
ncbi:PA2169 family four-helix-bundle protein [Aurantibacter sp.]|uniref:ferritin-like domain-containing protein n=1 Tax=Aurantibacter sp. TaxID=2807103 RepID=UPI0032659C53